MRGCAHAGVLRKRDQSWELRVFLGFDPASGKRKYATRSVRGTEPYAQRALEAMVAEADQGRLVQTKATLGELLERWFETAEPDFSPRRRSRHAA